MGGGGKEAMIKKDFEHGDVTTEGVKVICGVWGRARSPIEEEESMIMVGLGFDNLED